MTQPPQTPPAPLPPVAGFATVITLNGTSTNIANIENILKALLDAGYKMISRMAPAQANPDGSIAGVWLLGLPAPAPGGQSSLLTTGAPAQPSAPSAPSDNQADESAAPKAPAANGKGLNPEGMPLKSAPESPPDGSP